MTTNSQPPQFNPDDLPRIHVPIPDPPSPEDRKRDNVIMIGVYVLLHLLLPFLPLLILFMLSLGLIVTDVIVGYEVFTTIHSRLREHPYMRNLRLLNPFHYIPDMRMRLVDAFVETIAPETTQELHED